MNGFKKYRIICISHGGGPLPLLGDPSHLAMVDFLSRLPGRLIEPKAVVVFSAHWEEPICTIQSKAEPRLYFDYWGFPEESYHYRYAAEGNPRLADRLAACLDEAGLPWALDSQRDWDHGVFVPLMLTYPKGGIPVIQISLCNSLNAQEHLEIGRILSAIPDPDILWIGSGFSFHNLRAFDFGPGETRDPRNEDFQDWLRQVVTRPERREREEALGFWEQAPHARYCHPREEHLLPLHICAGLAGKEAEVLFDAPIAGKRCLALGWS